MALASQRRSGVYQSFASAGAAVGDRLTYRLPVPDGSYVLRLHLMEYWATAGRLMDIEVNGVVQATDYSIISSRRRNNMESGGVGVTVTAIGGEGMYVEFDHENGIWIFPPC